MQTKGVGNIIHSLGVTVFELFRRLNRFIRHVVRKQRGWSHRCDVTHGHLPAALSLRDLSSNYGWLVPYTSVNG